MARRLWIPLLAFTNFLIGEDGDTKPPRPLSIGDKAIDFRLPGVDGKDYSLRDFSKAKILAVVFTCNHCPTAQAYEDRIKKLVVDYKDRGVALVAISPNDPKAVRLNELGYTDLGDSFEDMKIRAKHRKFNFPYLYDGDKQEISRAYGAKATPHVVLFDSERRLRYSGRIDNSESGRDIKSHDVRNALNALLAGRPVPVERTRVFGCSVKWSSKREANERYLEKLAQERVALEMIDSEAVKKLRENKSKKLRLVNVWATWCGPCLIELPDLVTANRMYRHRNFELITISIDSPAKRQDVLQVVRKRQASNKNYLYNSEDRDKLAEALDEKWSGAVPLTLLVEPGGKIRFRKEGPVDPLTLRRAIVDYLGRTYR